MEPFFDGGLFELAALILIGYVFNYIFLKKYLLIIYSIITIAAPVVLLFYHEGELFYYLCAVCIINAILLIITLWKFRDSFGNTPLFDVEGLRKKILRKREVKN